MTASKEVNNFTHYISQEFLRRKVVTRMFQRQINYATGIRTNSVIYIPPNVIKNINYNEVSGESNIKMETRNAGLSGETLKITLHIRYFVEN
jgi:hypothetical protein